MIRDYIEQLSQPNKSDSSDLTSRESEVLQLLAEGNTIKQIAKKLEISMKTVESHRGTMMKKLKISSIPELTKYAIKEGIVSI